MISVISVMYMDSSKPATAWFQDFAVSACSSRIHTRNPVRPPLLICVALIMKVKGEIEAASLRRERRVEGTS